MLRSSGAETRREVSVSSISPKILIIEDDAVDRMHIERLLAEIFGSALRLDVATNWEEGVEAVAANAHDICIVDYFLGAGTGLELISRAPESGDVRLFILLTGQEDHRIDVAASRAGVADFLVKRDLNVRRLERSLRYACESMRQKRLLIEQKEELRTAKAEIEEEVQKQQALTEELSQVQHDLTEALVRAEESELQYRWLAQHDLLTKIPNRVLFKEKLSKSLRQASRSQKSLALFLLDVDRFKWVNDSFGHQAGDELLVQVAQRLTDTVRETDVVARVGGDEFAIVVTNLEDQNSASVVAEKVISALAEVFEILDHQVTTGASIGIALCSGQDGRTPETLIQEADSALYRAKDAGRGVFRFYDDALDKEVQRTLLLKEELPKAIDSSDLALVFQPKVDLATAEVVGFEALARWTHPELGAISPGEFIPMAETTGQIVPLSSWIFEHAFGVMTSWKETALDGLPVALNLSAFQLKQQGLVEELQELMRRHSVSPILLELEVTETAALENLDLAVVQLNKLRELGISVAIDDFGTGYSSLALATSLPVDRLKIDRSFVSGVLENSADAAAVCSTITLAHSLGLRTVAEGVETDEQLVRLGRYGCDEAQGYFFGRPMPPCQIPGWYETRKRQYAAPA
ncbi:bifunctional diguanylate cyclase/phosphodiesterase [Pelagibius sp.]|uniref:putative bifunctional diguanylate cyclase/phosphodiesterase n=1 Tax=Pelagibius sp. TaxID=1931238 RepID=UPI00261FE6D0|nr:EAL domain-containing protein [Pelagibius sp.]